MHLYSWCLHVYANVNLRVCIHVETWIVRHWIQLLAAGESQAAGQHSRESWGARWVAVSGEAASFLPREVSLGSKTFA